MEGKELMGTMEGYRVYRKSSLGVLRQASCRAAIYIEDSRIRSFMDDLV